MTITEERPITATHETYHASLDELVTDLCWYATQSDTECEHALRAIEDRYGLRDDEPKQLSKDDTIDLETLVNADYPRAIISLIAVVAPVIRARLEAMGDLLPTIRQAFDIEEMPGDAAETFMLNIFTGAGIEDRFVGRDPKALAAVAR